MGNFQHNVEAYHDVILFFLQIALIAPLTAAFVEIYNRKAKAAVRSTSIMIINEQLLNLYGALAMAYERMRFLDVYSIIAESLAGTQHSLRKPNWEETPKMLNDREIAIDRHNKNVEFHEKSNDDNIGSSIYHFESAARKAILLNSSLILFSGTFDADELDKMARLSLSLVRISENCDQFVFFIGQIRRGNIELTQSPFCIDYDMVLDEWEKYLDEVGSIKQKSLRMRFVSMLSTMLGYKNIFGTISNDKRKDMKGWAAKLKEVGTISIEDQKKVIKEIRSTDFSVYKKVLIS